ncbi:MAG TPA: hypothetical protein VFW44_18215 [Bryobacteraceae bacterium]|nr:hypothetical protein [Bryobacteraceae bacterium]
MRALERIASINRFWQWLAIFLAMDLVSATVETWLRGRSLLEGIGLFTFRSVDSVILAALFCALGRRHSARNMQ